MQANQNVIRMAREMDAFSMLETAAQNKEDEAGELALRIGVEPDKKTKEALQRRRERLTAEAAVLRSRQGRCRRALDSLDRRERYLIEHMYVLHVPVLEIMEALAMEKSSFYRLRQRAAASFLRAMYGVDADAP